MVSGGYEWLWVVMSGYGWYVFMSGYWWLRVVMGGCEWL